MIKKVKKFIPLKPSANKPIRQALIALETALTYEELEDVIYFVNKAINTNRKKTK